MSFSLFSRTNRAIALYCTLALSGCSLVWHSDDPRVQPNAGTCPAPNWPYMVDAAMTAATLSSAIAIQTEAVKLNDVGIEAPKFHVSIPLFLVATAFATSTLGGIGEVSGCERIEEDAFMSRGSIGGSYGYPSN